jgi:DNA replication protein DnaD
VRYNLKYKVTMARAMFEYTKTVLKKVSFNSELFCKELEKGLESLLPYEKEELLIWLKSFTENKPELLVCMALLR